MSHYLALFFCLHHNSELKKTTLFNMWRSIKSVLYVVWCRARTDAAVCVCVFEGVEDRNFVDVWFADSTLFLWINVGFKIRETVKLKAKKTFLVLPYDWLNKVAEENFYNDKNGTFFFDGLISAFLKAQINTFSRNEPKKCWRIQSACGKTAVIVGPIMKIMRVPAAVRAIIKRISIINIFLEPQSLAIK